MERAGFKCEACGNGKDTLNVHHKEYVKGNEPWEYNETQLACLCETCHVLVERVKRMASYQIAGRFLLPLSHVYCRIGESLHCDEQRPVDILRAAFIATLATEIMGNIESYLSGCDLLPEPDKWNLIRFEIEGIIHEGLVQFGGFRT